MKRHAEITFEIEETTVLRHGERMEKKFCSNCEAVVEMASPYLAAAISGLSEREIFRLIEESKLHFTEAERVFVCQKSLEIYAPIQKITTGGFSD